MTNQHTPPATVSEALNALADLMESHPTSISHVTLANLMTRVLDGPSSTGWKATRHPEMARQMTAAIAPMGFLSPVPSAEQVRKAATPVPATTLICQTGTHSVRLRLDEPVTIDLGGHPDYPRNIPVTELAVIYETTRKPGTDPTTTVTSISYVLDDEEDKAAFVHPDYLETPEEWPEWVRELVDANQPTTA